MMTMICAAAFCGSVYAEGNGAMGEGIVDNETPIVSTELSLAFDSKYMSYGLVDNKDPIITPAAALTFFDHLTLEASAIFATTEYGKKYGGHGNRAARYTELDPGASFAWTFTPEDYARLPTAVEVAFGYLYEYHPRSMGSGRGEPGEDTQFVTAEIGLPDLWVEPKFVCERDIDRDNGTYLNLELGHSFTLIEGQNADAGPALIFRPSVAQGFGNTQRTRGYGLAENHGGLMDTSVKGELAWNIRPGLMLSGYVAYYDYRFDSTLCEASRSYEATGRWDNSWNFVGGLSLAVSF